MSSSSSRTSTRRRGPAAIVFSMSHAPADEKTVKPLAPVPALAAALAVLLLTGASAHALRLPAARHCPVFPANNPWNQRVDKLPVSADSAELIASIGVDALVLADFGSGTWDGGPVGMQFDVVTRTSARSRVALEYGGASQL